MAVATDGLNDTLLYRETEADPFRPWPPPTFKDTLAPLFFTFDNRYLYVSSNLGRDKQAIYRYDLDKGELLDLIYENPEVDVACSSVEGPQGHYRGVVLYRQAPLSLLRPGPERTPGRPWKSSSPGYEVVAGDGGPT